MFLCRFLCQSWKESNSDYEKESNIRDIIMKTEMFSCIFCLSQFLVKWMNKCLCYPCRRCKLSQTSETAALGNCQQWRWWCFFWGQWHAYSPQSRRRVTPSSSWLTALPPLLMGCWWCRCCTTGTHPLRPRRGRVVNPRGNRVLEWVRLINSNVEWIGMFSMVGARGRGVFGEQDWVAV